VGPSGLKKASSLQLFDVKRLLYCVSLSPAFLILCIDVSTQTTINSYVSSIGYMIELKFQPFFLPPSILLSLHNHYAHFAIYGSIQWLQNKIIKREISGNYKLIIGLTQCNEAARYRVSQYSMAITLRYIQLERR